MRNRMSELFFGLKINQKPEKPTLQRFVHTSQLLFRGEHTHALGNLTILEHDPFIY